MAPGVLAGHVDVELVMRMLDDRDAQAKRIEMRDQPRQQRGLARTAPACKADDFHSSSVSASDRSLMEPASPTSLRAQRSNPGMHPRRQPGLLRFARNDE